MPTFSRTSSRRCPPASTGAGVSHPFLGQLCTRPGSRASFLAGPTPPSRPVLPAARQPTVGLRRGSLGDREVSLGDHPRLARPPEEVHRLRALEPAVEPLLDHLPL